MQERGTRGTVWMGAEWSCLCHVGILHESSIKKSTLVLYDASKLAQYDDAKFFVQ